MAAKKLPKGYYDPADHVLVHKDYLDGLIDALNFIHKNSGDPVMEYRCEAALGQQMYADAEPGQVAADLAREDEAGK